MAEATERGEIAFPWLPDGYLWLLVGLALAVVVLSAEPGTWARVVSTLGLHWPGR